MTTLQTLQRGNLSLFALVIYLHIHIHHEHEEHSLEKPYTTRNAGKLVCYEPFRPIGSKEHRRGEEGKMKKLFTLGSLLRPLILRR